MNESPIVAAWRDEGRVEGRAWGRDEGRALGAIEGRREDIVRLLRLKFPGEVPADLEAEVETQDEPDVLARCLDAVITSSTLREYRGNAGL